MVADRARRRAGDDEIVFAAERVRGERAADDLEGPLHIVPVRRRAELAPCPFGEGVELILDMILGQWLEPGAQCDLAGERQTGETDQFLIFDEDAVQRDPPARRQTRRRIDRGAGFRCGVERNDDAFDLLCHVRA